MWNDIGRASLCQRQRVLNVNTFHRRTLLARQVSSLATRRMVPIFDILEPLETLWEFYCNRDDILLELLQRGASFAKKNSVRAVGFLLIACSAAQALALFGIIGDRGEGLITFLRESESLQDYGVERVLQKTAAGMADVGVKAFNQYRRWGNKSKFAVAVAVGALFSNAAVNITTFSVKLLISSFLVVEGLSFAGVIGEPGESFVEYIASHEKKLEWVKKTRQFRDAVRKNVSFDALETFYEAAVDEEKVACMGFAFGSVMAMFT